MYPSIGSVVNLAIKKEITTVLEVKTSPIASVAVAFNVEELILLPMDLLNFESHNLKPIEISNNKNGIV